MAAAVPGVKAVFDRALEIESLAERDAYLAEVCAGAPGVRQKVEALLRAYADAGRFLESSPLADSPEGPAGATQRTPGTDEHVGKVIAGKYKLMEEIGAGGMGRVFMAQQIEPVKRAVAVKVIKVGMDSKAILARFEAERQALAMMDHPNIARVLDAGATESGRPFFVMELVKGVPITQFCDERKLTPHQRLELFVPVCQAIQHAHQKGIIHRDIKPSNVLVALYDERPVPKVIDFGIAKATGEPLTDKTLMTGYGAVVGTPEYMSPEQASFNQVDVDTRSDVYALGVLLYELLTGTTPIDRKSLGAAAILEILRVVREVEAPRPSAKLSTLDTLASVAANRGTEPAKLSKLMRGELDWILLKALEKDRTRRYDTANGFARDLQRYLADEVVEARPPSTGYRLKKFVRRHKGKVIAASLVLFALLAGMAGTTFGLVRAEQQRQGAERSADAERLAKIEAQDERTNALKAADAEKTANAQAQKRLAQIEKANDILASIFENLDPKEIAKKERPLQAILVEKLDKAVGQLNGESIGDPLVVASMQQKFGLSLLGLGEPSKAITLLKKARATYQTALGPKHPVTLAGTNNLAGAYWAAEERDQAVALFEEAFQFRRAELGPDHPDTLISMNNLAGAYRDVGKLDLALPLFEETLGLQKAKLGPNHPHVFASMNNLAVAYRDAKKPALALPLFEEALKLRRAELGREHPDTFPSMNNLAMAYWDAGKFDLAVPLFEETLKLCRAKLGPDHPDTLTSINNLIGVYREAGKPALALPLIEEILKFQTAKLGLDHPHVLTTKRDLEFLRAVLSAEERYRAKMVELGPKHIDTLLAHRDLAQRYLVTGRLDDAESALLEVLQGMSDRAPDDPIVVFTMGLLRRCLTARQKVGPDAWTTFNTQSLLGGALLGQKKYSDAEPLLQKGYEGLKQRENAIPPRGAARIPEALERLIELCIATNKPDEATKWRAERAKYPAEKAPPPREKK